MGYMMFSYRNFVLAKKNAIGAELPVVLRSQGCHDYLKSGLSFVLIGGDLETLLFLVSSDGT